MSQTTLDLLPPAPALAPVIGGTDPVTRTGFQIGWDHARHALVPPAELLLEGTPVAQGWMAARAVFGHRTLAATRTVRLWLQLRTTAWRQGVVFDEVQVTPHYLAQIHVDRCPVLRQPLGGAAGSPLAATVERLNPQAAFRRRQSCRDEPGRRQRTPRPERARPGAPRPPGRALR